MKQQRKLQVTLSEAKRMQQLAGVAEGVLKESRGVRLKNEIDILDFAKSNRGARYLIWMEGFHQVSVGEKGELGEGSWEDIIEYCREIVDERVDSVEELLEKVSKSEDVVRIFLK
jgi:hypothetical protein